jgi:tetratricopeptide (TPR) repeat protein
MRWIGVILGLVVSANSAFACYNDMDTNLTELRDNLDVTLALVGRFTIYPNEYYEKRIQIQSAILKENPNNLDAYDNIAVAYDRIGDSANAMKWIAEKRKHLGRNPGEHHLYSTEANEGTILIVRWIRGHKAGDITDAIAAEKHIKRALEINPNAHFGREFAQLYCIQAMVECGRDEQWMRKFTNTLTAIADKNQVDRKKLRFGIAGMMVLGAAWDMPPMIQAIANLVPDDYQMASLCRLRLDTHDSGSDSKAFPISNEKHVNRLERQFLYQLIDNGRQFQENRRDWIEDQLAKGSHPDTDKNFWNGFTDVKPIAKSDYLVIRRKPFWQKPESYLPILYAIGVAGALILPVGYYVYRQRRFIRRGF